MKSLARACFMVTVLSICACASVPMAPAEADLAAKTFRPPSPDRAHIYVYRNESMGAGVKMDLRLNGQPVGTLVAKTFTVIPVSPGHHTLVSEAENNSELPIDARSGETLFVWQEVKMGVLYARNQLQLVSADDGRKGVSECKLIAAPPSATPPPAVAPPAVQSPPPVVAKPAPPTS